MKKTKRAAILIATAVLACGAVAFSACENEGGELTKNDGGVKVNQTQWQERLSLRSYENYTIVDNKFQLNENGNPEFADTFSYKVDKKNKVTLTQTYLRSGSSSEKEDLFEYTFSYKNNYYCCAISKSTSVSELTKEEFDNLFDCCYFVDEYIINNFDLFEYDSETCKYQLNEEVSLDESGVSVMTYIIRFFKNGGFKFEVSLPQGIVEEFYTESLNSTTVTVPNQAYADVDAYLANKTN